MNGTNSCQQQPSTQLTAPIVSRLEQIEKNVGLVDNIATVEIKAEPIVAENEETQKHVQQENSFHAQILAELRKINERLDNVESILLGNTPVVNRTPKKPPILPMNTTSEVIQFNTVNEETYQTVVRYLGYLGGSSVRESLSLCLKESLSGDCVTHFTWMGRDIGRRPVCTPLYNTKLARAIFDAACSNRHYPTPTKTEFASHMKEAIRVAKQRTRNQLLSKKRRHSDDEEDF